MNEVKITSRLEFGRLINNKLKERGITCHGLAKELNQSFAHTTLFLYTKGQSFPNNDFKLEELCEYLGIDINRLDLVSLRRRNRDPLPSTETEDKSMSKGTNGSAHPNKDLNAFEEVKVVHNFSFKSDSKFPGYKIGRNDEIIIGESNAIHQVFDLLYNINSNPDQDSIVLITGDTGTGKELVAKAVHYRGRRKESPFIGINITTVTETLLESELFGHKKGSFTDARANKEGFFETVKDGTLFLDEIGSLHPNAQAKLLRVLQEKYFYRVGDTAIKQFNGRVVVATKEDLEKLVADKTFREDLYYRINVIRVNVPKISEREQDIPLLFSYFVDKYNKKYSKNYKLIPNKDGFSAMQNYAFPGNVRELEHLVTKAIFLYPTSETVRIEEVIIKKERYEVIEYSIKEKFVVAAMERMNGIHKLERPKMEAILRTYFDNKANITRCQANLGLSRRQIHYFIENNGIKVEALRDIYLISVGR